MRTRVPAFAVAALLAAFVACQKSETTETSTVSTQASTNSTTESTAATDTTMTTGTTTTPTATMTATSTTTSGSEQIKEGAKELGQGLKEEARKAAVATGAAMQRGGAELQQKAEQAAPQPTTPVPASTPPPAAPSTSASGNAANGSAIFQSKCVACHGADASSNTAMGKKYNIPDLRSAAVQGMSDAQLANMIANGKPGGFSATAHKSKALTQAQIQDVIAYLRSIRQ